MHDTLTCPRATHSEVWGGESDGEVRRLTHSTRRSSRCSRREPRRSSGEQPTGLSFRAS
ncbi:MAG: hypothetical protein WKH64_07135 [Chloroflexia bacterium]